MDLLAEVKRRLIERGGDADGSIPLQFVFDTLAAVQAEQGECPRCGLSADASLHTQTAEQCTSFMVEANGPGSTCANPAEHHAFPVLG